MKRGTFVMYSVGVLSIALALSACVPSAPTHSVETIGELATINFAKVEVGFGSPAPISVTVDARYPNSCAQFSQIHQSLLKEGEETKISIEVYTSNMGDVCRQQDALSFRMVLPINAVALPKGVYSVEVNGVDAGTFEFQH